MIWVGELIVTVIEVVNATEMFRALMGDVRPARLYAELADPDGFGQVLEFLDSWARKWG